MTNFKILWHLKVALNIHPQNPKDKKVIWESLNIYQIGFQTYYHEITLRFANLTETSNKLFSLTKSKLGRVIRKYLERLQSN